MTKEAANRIAWFFYRYPEGGSGPEYERDVRRAQENLLALWFVRREFRAARRHWKPQGRVRTRVHGG